MEERGNKTIICSVVFLDIVEYSKKSVSGQISLKERFNAFLSIAIRDVPVNDRIILDTGDGAAISFLGDISDALHAALSMRSSLLSEGVRMEPPLLVRIGVNLGPVRLVKDINGQPNIVGDGINVAQRVMGFADPGQILVSRSYYDAVSRLSQEYAGMFHYQGSRTDKHVREHEVYAIGYPGDFTSTQQSLAKQSRQAGATGFDAVLFRLENYWDEFVAIMARWERVAITAFRNASGKQRAAAIGVVAVVLVTLTALTIKLASHSAPQHTQIASTEQADPGKPPVAAATEPAQSKAVAKGARDAEDAEKVSPKPNKKPHSEKKVQGVKESSRVRTLAETIGAPAVVSLGILPWGEVYLDGRMQGVSPPLLELQVARGKHEIKIRNTTFPVYTKVITVKPGERIRIKHTFAN
ncbi:adenylate/guanylate cyclase domain-containing protein [Sideroxydans lithotrophicus]|uniref:Putative adenylate/guanylate cyclase n=1 Tax=Sideroxydans lithotrophicus (strain ES-1) TaxID=580332 RepID=D5CRC0_SIDLE|nr:adenylate/guanylate cyclase domain-containing protein [Sideroxydans lithotrophicus]ADE11506.1 putative adenylate/guanylate cyclase [Sideroxydans lithotrophicus ES-1]